MLAAPPFRWCDGERVIRFGRGTLAEAVELIRPPYVLLTTKRAGAVAPDLAAAATAVHHVPAGRVDELAAELRPHVKGELLVALGGGRVIDTAKALAAADPPRRVAAIPTTLSAAEMTGIHRHAAGVGPQTPRVRPAVVLNDPELCASQPEPELAASALNSLGHAAEAPLTPLRNPVATLAALRAAALIAGAFSRGSPPDREALALGALLSGYAIDSTGYGLHHVLSQTLVRIAGVGHGSANAVMLPHTLGALRRRFPEELASFATAVNGDPVAVAAALTERTGVTRLRDLGLERERLEDCVEAASERAELALTPPAADSGELRALYEAAW